MSFDVNEGRKLRAAGMSWRALSRHFGVSFESVRRRIDPSYADDRHAAALLAQENRRRRAKELSGKIHFGPITSQETKRDALARLAEVPPDTRDLTARLLGDPLPGRRAIDLRSAE